MNTLQPFDPMRAGDTWARPRRSKRARREDQLADAIDRLERAEAKMRRTFKAWERATAAVARLNKIMTREAAEQVQS